MKVDNLLRQLSENRAKSKKKAKTKKNKQNKTEDDGDDDIASRLGSIITGLRKSILGGK